MQAFDKKFSHFFSFVLHLYIPLTINILTHKFHFFTTNTNNSITTNTNNSTTIYNNNCANGINTGKIVLSKNPVFTRNPAKKYFKKYIVARTLHYIVVDNYIQKKARISPCHKPNKQNIILVQLPN